MDDVCVTNTNRQIHALQGNVGKLKTEVMAERIRLINPDCQIHIVDDFITEENLQEYVNNRFDFVVDAIDSLRAKVALLAYCKRQKIPLITNRRRWRADGSNKDRHYRFARTTQDPLAAKVRADLRRKFGFARDPKKKFGIPCVYSTEQLTYS